MKVSRLSSFRQSNQRRHNKTLNSSNKENYKSPDLNNLSCQSNIILQTPFKGIDLNMYDVKPLSTGYTKEEIKKYKIYRYFDILDEPTKDGIIDKRDLKLDYDFKRAQKFFQCDGDRIVRSNLDIPKIIASDIYPDILIRSTMEVGEDGRVTILSCDLDGDLSEIKLDGAEKPEDYLEVKSLHLKPAIPVIFGENRYMIETSKRNEKGDMRRDVTLIFTWNPDDKSLIRERCLVKNVILY